MLYDQVNLLITLKDERILTESRDKLIVRKNNKMGDNNNKAFFD